MDTSMTSLPEISERRKVMNKDASRSSLDTTISIDDPSLEKSRGKSPQKISINDFKILKNIGTGSYAKVVLAKHTKTAELFAIKTIDKSFIEKVEKIDQVHIERQILSSLSHPNIIKLYNTFHDKRKLYYVFECGERGDLREFLSTHGAISYDTAKFFAAEIVNALEYLHGKGIVHRDLKPENIVIDNNFHLKIIDFATATYLGKYFDMKEKMFKNIEDSGVYCSPCLLGTAEYISPEMITDATCGYEADLWALGCIIYQLFHNSLPFTGNTNHLIMSNILLHNMNSFNKSVPEDARDLILKLLVQNPKQRLGANNDFKSLKSHPFFKGIQFENIQNLNPPIKPSYEKTKTLCSSYISKGNCEKSEEEIEIQQFADFQIEFEDIPNKINLNKKKSTEIVIYEGVLKKKSPWFHFNRRKLVLFKDRVEYYDPIEDIKKGEIPLSKHCVALLKDYYTFEIFTPKRTFLFKLEHQGASTWCEKINNVLENLKKD